MGTNDKPTSFDIAALAGVSQPTVSRALRGDRTVSEATRLRIEAIARQLNYKVDRNASSLRSGQAKTLALLFFEDPLPDGSFINPFFLSMLGSILMRCAQKGYDLLTSFQQLSADWHKDYEDARKADGLILLGYGDWETYRSRLDDLVRQQTHFVRWGSVEPAWAPSSAATIAAAGATWDAIWSGADGGASPSSATPPATIPNSRIAIAAWATRWPRWDWPTIPACTSIRFRSSRAAMTRRGG